MEYPMHVERALRTSFKSSDDTARGLGRTVTGYCSRDVDRGLETKPRGDSKKEDPTCLQPSSSLHSFCPPLFCLCPRPRPSSFLRLFLLPPSFLVRRPALTCCP